MDCFVIHNGKKIPKDEFIRGLVDNLNLTEQQIKSSNNFLRSIGHAFGIEKTKSLSELEVRPRVGEEAPLRQQPEGATVPETKEEADKRVDEEEVVTDYKKIKNTKTEDLPDDIKKEVGFNTDDDFYRNVEGDLIWNYKEVPIETLEESIPDESMLGDLEDEYESMESLKEDIKKNGIKRPIVIAPNGIEGYHRLIAVQELGIKKIPVIQYEIITPKEVTPSEVQEEAEVLKPEGEGIIEKYDYNVIPEDAREPVRKLFTDKPLTVKDMDAILDVYDIAFKNYDTDFVIEGGTTDKYRLEKFNEWKEEAKEVIKTIKFEKKFLSEKKKLGEADNNKSTAMRMFGEGKKDKDVVTALGLSGKADMDKVREWRKDYDAQKISERTGIPLADKTPKVEKKKVKPTREPESLEEAVLDYLATGTIKPTPEFPRESLIAMGINPFKISKNGMSPDKIFETVAPTLWDAKYGGNVEQPAQSALFEELMYKYDTPQKRKEALEEMRKGKQIAEPVTEEVEGYDRLDEVVMNEYLDGDGNLRINEIIKDSEKIAKSANVDAGLILKYIKDRENQPLDYTFPEDIFGEYKEEITNDRAEEIIRTSDVEELNKSAEDIESKEKSKADLSDEEIQKSIDDTDQIILSAKAPPELFGREGADDLTKLRDYKKHLELSIEQIEKKYNEFEVNLIKGLDYSNTKAVNDFKDKYKLYGDKRGATLIEAYQNSYKTDKEITKLQKQTKKDVGLRGQQSMFAEEKPIVEEEIEEPGLPEAKQKESDQIGLFGKEAYSLRPDKKDIEKLPDDVKPLLEVVDDNPYYDDTNIIFSEFNTEYLTAEEIKERGYVPEEFNDYIVQKGEEGYEEGKTKYAVIQEGGSSVVGKAGTLLLSRGISPESFLEEIVHNIQQRLGEIKPELAREISEWEQSVRDLAKSNDVNIYQGLETFAKSFIYTFHNYQQQAPNLSPYYQLPKNIFDDFSKILNTSKSKQKDKLNKFREGKELLSVKPEVRDLVAVHNLTSENLKFADKMGGLAMPSMAIVKSNLGWNKYGEITLVANKEMISPEYGTKVYNRDIYSPTYPPIYREVNKKALDDKISEIQKTLGDEVLRSDAFSLGSFREKMVKGTYAVEDLGSNDHLQLYYLSKTNQLPPYILRNERLRYMPEFAGQYKLAKELIKKYPIVKEGVKTDEKWIEKETEKNYNDPNFYEHLDDATRKKFARDRAEEYERQNRSDEVDKERKKFIHDYIDGYIERTYLTEKMINLGDTEAEKNEWIKYHKELGQKLKDQAWDSYSYHWDVDKLLNPKKELSSFDYMHKRVEPLIEKQQKEYTKFLQDEFKDVLGAEYLKDRRGKKVAHNLGNAMDIMGSKIQGAEKTMTQGLGKSAGEAAKQFSSIDAIKKAKENIVTHEEFEKADKQLSESFFKLADKLKSYSSDRSDFGWDRLDNLSKAIGQIAKGRVNEENIGRYLSRNGFGSVPDFYYDQVMKVAQMMKDMPTEYFEAKKERSVALKEFAGAVVPDNVSKETLDILKKNGITKIEKYKFRNDKDRQKALNRFTDELFSAKAKPTISSIEELQRAKTIDVRNFVKAEIGNEAFTKLMEEAVEADTSPVLEGKTVEEMQGYAIDAAVHAKAMELVEGAGREKTIVDDMGNEVKEKPILAFNEFREQSELFNGRTFEVVDNTILIYTAKEWVKRGYPPEQHNFYKLKEGDEGFEKGTEKYRAIFGGSFNPGRGHYKLPRNAERIDIAEEIIHDTEDTINKGLPTLAGAIRGWKADAKRALGRNGNPVNDQELTELFAKSFLKQYGYDADIETLPIEENLFNAILEVANRSKSGEKIFDKHFKPKAKRKQKAPAQIGKPEKGFTFERGKLELLSAQAPRSPSVKYYRGERRGQTGEVFITTDKSVAANFGEVKEIKESEIPKNLYIADDKIDLAYKLGLLKEGDIAKENQVAYAFGFDAKVKKILEKQGYEGVKYLSGTFDAEEIHIFKGLAKPENRYQKLVEAEGLTYNGIQKGTEKTGDYVTWTDPETGSTHLLATKDFSREKLLEQRDSYRGKELLSAKPAQTETKEFKKWFGKSKLVDKEGKPIVFFHGSGKEGIEVFDPTKAGSVQRSDWGEGVYFTRSYSGADYYRREALKTTDPEGDRLYAEYVKKAKELGTSPMYEAIDLGWGSEKYKELQKYSEKWLEHRRTVGEGSGGEVYPVYIKMENPMVYQYVGITDPFLPEIAKGNGHDGIVIVNEPVEGDLSDYIDEVIVFDPKQIKSATKNRGTFDPNEPSILLSAKPEDKFKQKNIQERRSGVEKPITNKTIEHSDEMTFGVGLGQVIPEIGKAIKDAADSPTIQAMGGSKFVQEGKRLFNQFVTPPPVEAELNPDFQPIYRVAEKKLNRDYIFDQNDVLKRTMNNFKDFRKLNKDDKQSLLNILEKYHEEIFYTIAFGGKRSTAIKGIDKIISDYKPNDNVENILRQLDDLGKNSLGLIKQGEKEMLVEFRKKISNVLNEKEFLELFPEFKAGWKYVENVNETIDAIWNNDPNKRAKIADYLVENKYKDWGKSFYVNLSRPIEKSDYLVHIEKPLMDPEIVPETLQLSNKDRRFTYFESKSEANKFVADMEAKGWALKSRVARVDELLKSQSDWEGLDQSTLLHLFNTSNIEIPKEVVDALLKNIKEGYWDKHTIQRNYTPGLKWTSEEMEQNIVNLLAESSSKKNKTFGMAKMDKELLDLEERYGKAVRGVKTKENDLRKLKQSLDYAQRFASGLKISNNRVMDNIRGMMYLWDLGFFRPSFMLQQTTENFQTVMNLAISEGGLRIGELSFIKAGKDTGEVMVSLIEEKLGKPITIKDKELWQLINNLRTMEKVAPLGAKVLFGESGDPKIHYATIGKGMDAVRNILGSGGQAIEYITRIQTAATFYRIAKDKGMTDTNKITEYVADMIDLGKANYAKTGTIVALNPKSQKGMNEKTLGRAISQTFLVYKKWASANTGLYRLLWNKSKVAFFIKAMVGLGVHGIKKFPLFAGLLGIASFVMALLNEDTDKELQEIENKLNKEIGGQLGSVLNRGVGTYFGADISGLMQEGSALPSDVLGQQVQNMKSLEQLIYSSPRMILESAVGRPYSFAEDLVSSSVATVGLLSKDLSDKERRTKEKRILQSLPSTIRSIIQADIIEEEGLKYGAKQVIRKEDIEKKDLLIRKLGFQPEKFSKQGELADAVTPMIRKTTKQAIALIKQGKEDDAKKLYEDLYEAVELIDPYTEKQKESIDDVNSFISNYVLNKLGDVDREIIKDWNKGKTRRGRTIGRERISR